jgi:hypothetical protein
MNCAQADQLLVDYLYQELSLIRAQALQIHLRSCSACSSSLAGLVSTRQVLQYLQQREPPSPLLGVIMSAALGSSRLLRGSSESRTSLWNVVHHPAFVAAVVVVVVCVGVAVGERPPPNVMYEADRQETDGSGSVAMLPETQRRRQDYLEVAPPSPSKPEVGHSSSPLRFASTPVRKTHDFSKQRPLKTAARVVARLRLTPEGRPRARPRSAAPAPAGAEPSRHDLLARCDRAAASKRCLVALRCYNRLVLRSPERVHEVTGKARGCFAVLHQSGRLSKKETRMRFPGLVPLIKTGSRRGKSAAPIRRSRKE